MDNETLFEKVGGEVALELATSSLYAKIVLDDELAPFFKGMNVNRIEQRQREFLAYAFDGPTVNQKVDLRAAHAKLVKQGLNHQHFDRLVGHLSAVLEGLDIDPADKEEALQRVEKTRREVMGEVYTQEKRRKSMAGRLFGFVYGVTCYMMGVASLVFAGLWLGDMVLPVTLDSAPTGSIGTAVLINFALILGFSLQHSVMARPAFKEWWTQFVPASCERSTYVLLSGIAFFGMMYFWQPLGIDIWDLDGYASSVLYAGYGVGWALLLAATFAVNHFDLFGLRQVWLNLRGIEYTQLPFTESNMYRYSRHPLYVGWLMVIWLTPHMTISHLFFALGVTLYTLCAIGYEERDLVRFHPEYADYRRRVPKLFPRLGKRRQGYFLRPGAA